MLSSNVSIFIQNYCVFCQLAGLAQTPGSNSVDFKSEITAKEEIIELQEMRVSPIPSIRNRFGGISRSDFFCKKKKRKNFLLVFGKFVKSKQLANK